MSNRTPTATAKKTASAPKADSRQPRRLVAGLLALVIIGGLAGTLFLRSDWGRCQAYQITSGYRSDKIIQLGGQTFNVEVVEEPAELSKGLSDRQCIKTDQAMLFVYQQPRQLCFWMKDMRFPIDMIWLDGDKKIIGLKENADPATYPEQYCSAQPAQYVLEVAAGTVRDLRLALGQAIAF